MDNKPKQLTEQIATAVIAIGSFAADKQNKEQKYDYISADQVLDRAGKALAEMGVIVIPTITGSEVVTVERVNKSPRHDAKVTFNMIVMVGDQKTDAPWVGHGSDFLTPDKAVYKAITSGHKYFLMKLLNIGIGNEDGEHEPPQDDPEGEEPPAIQLFSPLSAEAVAIAAKVWNLPPDVTAREIGKMQLGKAIEKGEFIKIIKEKNNHVS